MFLKRMASIVEAVLVWFSDYNDVCLGNGRFIDKKRCYNLVIKLLDVVP